MPLKKSSSKKKASTHKMPDGTIMKGKKHPAKPKMSDSIVVKEKKKKVPKPKMKMGY